MKFGTRIKGFKVKQDGRGKVTLEPIAFYNRKDASARLRAKKSKTQKPIKQGVLGLFYKREG